MLVPSPPPTGLFPLFHSERAAQEPSPTLQRRQSCFPVPGDPKHPWNDQASCSGLGPASVLMARSSDEQV